MNQIEEPFDLKKEIIKCAKVFTLILIFAFVFATVLNMAGKYGMIILFIVCIPMIIILTKIKLNRMKENPEKKKTPLWR